jgi:hypothetical protein
MRQLWRARVHCETLRPLQLTFAHCVAHAGRQFGPGSARPGTMILFGTAYGADGCIGPGGGFGWNDFQVGPAAHACRGGCPTAPSNTSKSMSRAFIII